MKIFFALGGGQGGPRSIGIDLLNATRERGHFAAVLVPENDDLAQHARDLGFRCYVDNAIFGRSFQYGTAIRIARYMRMERPDVAYTYWIFPPRAMVRVAGVLTRSPVLAHVWTQQSWNRRAVIRGYQHALERWSARISGTTAASSTAVQAALAVARLSPEHVPIIHGGVDCQSIQDACTHIQGTEGARVIGSPILTYAASLDANKDQVFAVEAFARADLPDGARLLLVGGETEPGYLDRIRTTAQRLGASGRVVFAGAVSRPTCWNLLAGSDLALHVPVHEGFGFGALEAQALGLPVIATRAGGLTDIIEHGATGLLIAPGDVPGAAAAITRLLSDSEMRSSMSNAARTRACTLFSLDSSHDKIFGLLESLSAAHTV